MNKHVRPLAGAAMLTAIVATVAVAVGLFDGDFSRTVPVTVISSRAGLVMSSDAKVKMRGVEVGRVASIEAMPDGRAAIHLDMNPGKIGHIPANALVDIASTTAFGAKYVRLLPPPDPVPQKMYAGQVLQGDRITVEINTVFQRLTSVLAQIDPPKLNQTLGAFAKAVNGRGEKIGNTLTDLERFLAITESRLPNLAHDIAVLPAVTGAYADASSALLTVADNATRIGQTIVEEQENLDTLLISTIGLAEVGTEVLIQNRQPLTGLLGLLAPTTDLLQAYSPSINCLLEGIAVTLKAPPFPEPGIVASTGFTLGLERYRYPQDLPRVAATGGPNCEQVGLPQLAPNEVPPFVVANTGANPWQYGNQGIVLNSDGLKQYLFGPIDGPPRNSTQIGMPG